MAVFKRQLKDGMSQRCRDFQTYGTLEEIAKIAGGDPPWSER